MGGFVSAQGDMQQAQAYQQMAGLYVQQGSNTKQLMDLAAGDTAVRANQAAGGVSMKVGQTIGAQSAGYAASGVDPGSGSALDAMADSRMMGEYQKSIIQNNAMREAWGYRVHGMQALSQSELEAFGASNNANAAQNKAGADVMSGAVQAGTIVAGA